MHVSYKILPSQECTAYLSSQWLLCSVFATKNKVEASDPQFIARKQCEYPLCTRQNLGMPGIHWPTPPTVELAHCCAIFLCHLCFAIYLDNCSKWPTSKKTMWVSLCKCVRAKILAWPLHSSLDTTSLTRIYDILLIFLLFHFPTTNTLTLAQQIVTVCQEFKCL